jgi:general secretion pathway protein G
MSIAAAIPASKRLGRARNARLGLLLATAVAVVALFRASERRFRPTDATRAAMVETRTALKLYRDRHGGYPSTAEGMGALVKEGFLPSAPVDAWSRLLQYASDGREFELFSYGADGAPGGSGEDADLFSRDLQ